MEYQIASDTLLSQTKLTHTHTLGMCSSYCSWKAPHALFPDRTVHNLLPKQILQKPSRTPPLWQSSHTMQRNTEKCPTHPMAPSHLQLQRTKTACKCLVIYLNTQCNYWGAYKQILFLKKKTNKPRTSSMSNVFLIFVHRHSHTVFYYPWHQS